MTMSITSKYKPYKNGFGPYVPDTYKFDYPYTYRAPKGVSEDDYAEALANEHFTDAGKPDENNTWTIKNIGKLKDGETIESNNYIVFVKAKDNVGNVRIYGSNGIVLENLHDISVTYTESADGTVNRNTWDIRYLMHTETEAKKPKIRKL